MKITLSAINTPVESLASVMGAMKMGDIGQSHWVTEFENRVADYVGVKHCIATANGTMADAIAVAAMAKKHRRNTFIVPALTFIAHPNSVLYNGLKIQFVDVNADWTMNMEDASKYADTAIAFPSDIMGRIPNYLLTLSGRMPFLEDACEAFGSRRGDKKAGTFGEIGTFSFFVSHTITTGEGGAIVTDDDWLAHLCRQIRSHGRASETDATQKFHFSHVGFNGKMSGLTAAFGVGVMEHVEEYVERRHEVFERMNDALGLWNAGETYVVPHGYPVEFRGEMQRNTAMRELLEAGIECRKFFSCIPEHEAAYEFIKDRHTYHSTAVMIAQTYLYVPCHQNLSNDDVDYIVKTVERLHGVIR